MKTLKPAFFVALGFAAVMTLTAGATSPRKERDVCLAAPTGGGGFNMFILRDVAPLAPGGAISLQGFFFTTGVRKVGPLHGSATMVSDGTVRLGFFVHSTAESTNDFTISGITDENFVGTVGFDNDGDFKTNNTLTMEVVDCATVDIP